MPPVATRRAYAATKYLVIDGFQFLDAVTQPETGYTQGRADAAGDEGTYGIVDNQLNFPDMEWNFLDDEKGLNAAFIEKWRQAGALPGLLYETDGRSPDIIAGVKRIIDLGTCQVAEYVPSASDNESAEPKKIKLVHTRSGNQELPVL